MLCSSMKEMNPLSIFPFGRNGQPLVGAVRERSQKLREFQ